MTTRRRSFGPPLTVATLLESEANVARLTAHAGRLLQLQQQLEVALPRQLAKVVRVANYRLGKIVIHAANGAVAAKVRQVLPGLVEKYRQTGTEVNEIEIKVQPIRPTFKEAAREPAVPIGDNAKRGLTSLAQKLPQDAPLRAALERLIAKK
ncbi:MAG TPA: DciA family protein [Rhodocyclaceae bacterium]|nr:DciA family protein [Rhodocyclaceae bacterium]